MPTSFKPPIKITVYTLTPSGQLIECTECDGPNLRGRTAQKLDCATCDGTGYDNYFTTYVIPAYYNPRTLQKYDTQRGGYVLIGECSIKIDAAYGSLIDRAKHLEFNGATWQFSRMAVFGAGFGQPRITLALTRRR